MIECAPNRRLFVFLLVSLLFAGCSQLRRSSVDEEKEPHFIEGQKRAKRMDWDGAIQSFERALQANPNNASAHLELGVLYDQKKTNFVSAIYHYQRHLTLRTNSNMADVVKQNIVACTRELAKTVQYAVVTREVQRDLEKLAQTNALFRARIEFLEAELSRRPRYVTNFVTNFVGLPQTDRSSTRLTQATQALPVERAPEEPVESPRSTPSRSAARVASEPRETRRDRETSSSRERSRPEPAQPAARQVHTVRPGETLAALASRYGVSLQAMKAANPSAARGVRAGQKIIIPR